MRCTNIVICSRNDYYTVSHIWDNIKYSLEYARNITELEWEARLRYKTWLHRPVFYVSSGFSNGIACWFVPVPKTAPSSISKRYRWNDIFQFVYTERCKTMPNLQLYGAAFELGIMLYRKFFCPAQIEKRLANTQFCKHEEEIELCFIPRNCLVLCLGRNSGSEQFFYSITLKMHPTLS